MARFTGDAWLDRAMFAGDVRVGKATFTGKIRFDEATFDKGVHSNDAIVRHPETDSIWPVDWGMTDDHYPADGRDNPWHLSTRTQPPMPRG